MWSDKHQGIAGVEKIVAEYNVCKLNMTPQIKFKVKICESANHKYTGYTDIQIADELGSFYGAVGYGDTEEAALEDTIAEFYRTIATKAVWEEQDFQYMDPYGDF